MTASLSRPLVRLLDWAPVALFVVVMLVFEAMSGKFLTRDNFT